MFDNVDYDKVWLKYLFALQGTQVQVSPKHASKNKVEEAKFGTAPPVRITVANQGSYRSPTKHVLILVVTSILGAG